MATTALASSAVFCSAARPNGRAAPKRAASKPSKLWTPKAAAVDSPTLIVKDGDAESVMSGLTAKRREVILDMEEFAETEVRPRRVFDARRAFARRRGISPRANANAQPIDKIFSAPTFFSLLTSPLASPQNPPPPPRAQLLKLLKPTDKNWQPQDHLPNPESPDFLDEIAEVQKARSTISHWSPYDRVGAARAVP